MEEALVIHWAVVVMKNKTVAYVIQNVKIIIMAKVLFAIKDVLVQLALIVVHSVLKVRLIVARN